MKLFTILTLCSLLTVPSAHAQFRSVQACSPLKPCDHGEGRCRNNQDCKSGLQCTPNLGRAYNYSYTMPTISVCNGPSTLRIPEKDRIDTRLPGYGVFHRPFYLSPSDIKLEGRVKIPVILADFHDYDPRVDQSRPDLGTGGPYPNYVQPTRQQIWQYLNSKQGPRGYYFAASGGKLDLQFDVYGWVGSSKYTNKGYRHYLKIKPYWENDFILAAVAYHGFDPRKYDSDHNGTVDILMTLYEGPGGLGANGGAIHGVQSRSTVSALFRSSDPEYHKHRQQSVSISTSVRMPVFSPYNLQKPDRHSLRTAIHELEHALFGNFDHYFTPNSLGHYALSANASTTLSAMEKYIFARWVEPTTIRHDGFYKLDSHHLSHGDKYDPAKNYLYKIENPENPNHYLLIEYQNSKTASGRDPEFPETKPKQDGLVIFEIFGNLNESTTTGSKNSIKRHHPKIPNKNPYAITFGSNPGYDDYITNLGPLRLHFSTNFSQSNTVNTFWFQVRNLGAKRLDDGLVANARALDRKWAIQVAGSGYFTNWGGLNGKYLWSVAHNGWLLLLPDGRLYLWNNVKGETGELIASLGRGYYQQPRKLHSPY